MRRTIRSLAIAAVLGAAAAVPLGAAVLAAGEAATPATITIDNFTFNPKGLTVKTGTTITWSNKDDIPHGIASTNNAFKKSKALDTAPGTYQYFCYLHPRMTGTIVVEADAGGGAGH
jgi:plastocyanin